MIELTLISGAVVAIVVLVLLYISSDRHGNPDELGTEFHYYEHRKEEDNDKI